MEVKLGKFTGTLRKPASFMTAREVTMAVGQNALRGLGAALGVCWGGKPMRATLAASKWDMMAYGGAIVDELVGLGVPEADIYAAGREALDLVIGSLPREEEVATAEGFTDGPTGPSTP